MNINVKAKIRIESVHKLTPLQMGMLFHAMYAPDSIAYFEQLSCCLNGDIEPHKFEQALDLLAQRHAILRMGIVTKGQQDPLQVVLEKATIPLTRYDWRDRSAAVQETSLQRLLKEDRQTGFNLNRPPLMRFILVHCSEQEWRLVWSYHHLLMDGWSVQLLLKDFFRLMVGDRTEASPKPFSDYLGWLDRQPQEAARDFWKSLLGDLNSATPLGVDKTADVRGVKEFTEHRHILMAPELSHTISECKVSVSTLLMASWAGLLGHYARRDDVTFGVTLSGRTIDLPGVENIVGLLINTLPLRLRLRPHCKVANWLVEVQEMQFSLQRYSYSSLSETQNCSGVPQGTPLFESLVIIDNFPVSDLHVSEKLSFKLAGVDMFERTHYPISLTMVPKEGEVLLKLGYDRNRISDESAKKLIKNFERLLNELIRRPESTLEQWTACLGSSIPQGISELHRHTHAEKLAEHFWRNYFRGLELISPAGEETGRRGILQRLTTELSPTLTQRITRLAAHQQVAVNTLTLVQSAWAVTLSRFSGQQEVLFGVNISICSEKNASGISSLPLRIDCAPDTSLASLFRKVQTSQKKIRQHAKVHPVDIQHWSGFALDQSLYDSVLISEDTQGTADNLPIENMTVAESSQYAFLLYIKLRDTAITLKAVYDPERISQVRAGLLLDGVNSLLKQMAAGTTHIGALQLADRQQKAMLQQQEEEADPDLLVLFRRAADLWPEKRAVTGVDHELSYAQLMIESRNYAAQLVANGVRPGTVVAVCLDRSADLLSALLGVLWAGAQYVPLDPNHPATRLAMILEDAAPHLVIVDAANEAAFASIRQLCYERDRRQTDIALPGDTLSPLAPAYTIFTSGSTGRPKGVQVTHGALANILLHFQRSPGLDADDCLLAVTTLSFDIAALELFLPLSCGAEVVIAENSRTANGRLLAELITRHDISVMQATPASWRMLLASDWEPPEKFRAWCGGEALPLELARDLLAHGVRLWNLYGPTETTIWSAETEISAPLAAERPVPIGCPIRKTTLYVLDFAEHCLPAGVNGELAIGGAGLSTGYLRDPNQTARRFRPDPFSARPGSRLYMTGDFARASSDGRIEVLGRLDNQIKLNGFRIELGEVEAALRALPGVRDASATIDKTVVSEQIIGYLVTTDDAPEEGVWREALAARLPRYMVPTAFSVLSALPLTPNGKIDRKALPQICSTLYIAPRTPKQKTLATIWQEVLGVEQVGLTDNYFTLGGNSILSIRIVTKAIAQGINLSIEDLFKKLTIERLTESCAFPIQAINEQLVEAFAMLTDEDRSAIPAGAVDGYPLSELQAGMLFHSGSFGTHQLYHNVVSYWIDNPTLEVTQVRQRLRKLMAAHPVLRTGFSLSGYSRPLQWVWEQAEPHIEEEDLRDVSTIAQQTLIGRAQQRLREERFDLSKPPLLRMLFQRLDCRRWQVTIALHHVIMDGWSIASLLTALLSVEEPETTEPQHIFREFIHLEQQALQDTEAHSFWQKELKDLPVTSFPRWPFTSKKSEITRQTNYENQLPPLLYLALSALAKEKGLPLKSVLLAIHFRVLAHWSGEREVITGLVTNCRPERAGSTEALGLFLNTLPMRMNIGDLTWRELLETVQQAESDQLPHRRFAMAELRRMLKNRTLFETTFNFVDFYVHNEAIRGGQTQILNVTGSQALDIPMATSFSIDRQHETLHLILTCDGTLFPAAQVQAIGENYLRAAQSMIENPEALCEGISLLSAEGLEEIKRRSSGPSPVSRPQSVLQAFQAVVKTHPNELAVVSAEGEMDYATLDRRSSELAAHMQLAKLKPDSPVALLFNRSLELIVAMLAAMKTACPYVPLATYLPQGRLAEILADVRPQAMLSMKTLQHFLPVGSDVGHLLLLDVLPATPKPLPALLPAHPNMLAYLLFTSGSTGHPKGIGIPVSALANHMAWMQRCFPLAPGDRVLQKTAIGFDASIWEFWAPLTAGATLVLPSDDVQSDTISMLEAVKENAITILQVVPSVLDILTEAPELAACHSLHRVFVGGEVLQAATIERFERMLRVPLINLYGPTEATIDSTFSCYRGNANKVVSIGDIIDGVSVYVLDKFQQLTGVGIYGELWISGAGLARGYWKNAAETAASFRPDPFSSRPGQRMYRTGDVVRWLPKDGLQYAGRCDRQIQLHGNRIELDDIEAVLSRQPGITHSAVRIATEGREQLLAWVMGPAAQEPARVLSGLRNSLPDYMLPQRVIAISNWPLTPNGKTDYLALSALATAPEPIKQLAGMEPVNEIESDLVEIWQRLLPKLTPGVTVNFFEMGGDSILAIQISAEMRRRGWLMLPRHLFEQPTIRELASVILPAKNHQQPQHEAPVGLLPLSSTQHWFFDLQLSDQAHWNQAVALRVPQSVQPHRLHNALYRLVSLHEAFRLRFVEKKTGWFAQLSADAGDWYISVNVSDLAADECAKTTTALAQDTQRSLNLEEGPLLKAVYLDRGLEKEGRLLLVIHHLIVDGVSWRILLNEINLLVAGNELTPPPIGFGAWLALKGKKDHPIANYWLRQAEKKVEENKSPSFIQPQQDCFYSQVQSIEKSFDRHTTQQFINHSQFYLKARPVELLLASIVFALRNSMEKGRVTMTLEGHGRDNIGELQLERTVGLFTVLYPVTFDLQDTHSEMIVLRTVKKTLREVPDGGYGYGQLQQGAPLPLVSFNYLGQFEENDERGLTVVNETVGDSEDPQGKRPFALEIVAFIRDSQLTLRCVFDDRVPEVANITGLIDSASDCLHKMLTREDVFTAWTLQDFPLAGVEEQSLSVALGNSCRDLSDLWQATPTQEGMLFHSRLEKRASEVYLEQIVMQLHEDIDATLLTQAWNIVVNRHDALRVSFTWEDLNRPHLRVWRSVEVPFEAVEMAEEVDTTQLATFMEQDRQRGIILTNAPMMRISLLKKHGRPWRLVWLHHHALLDGWSMALIFKDLAECYRALKLKQSWPTNPAPSYATYLRYLQQQTANLEATEQFWRDYFRGLEVVSPAGEETRRRGIHQRLARKFSDKLTQRIFGLAASQQVTVNNLVQIAYGVALSRLSGRQEVLFGVTLSGRPAELTCSESMVGLFIQTLPLRINCAPSVSVTTVLQQVQAMNEGIEQHANVHPSKIQCWSGLTAGQTLYDSVLIYENYPISPGLMEASNSLEIDVTDVLDHPHYAFSLYAKPRSGSLTLEAVYDPERISQARAALLLDGVGSLLEQMAAGTTHLGALQLADRQQKATLQQQEEEAAPDLLVLFRRAADLWPEKRAVTGVDHELSYAQLLAESRNYAIHLATHGVRPGTVVAVCLDRGADMLSALLGVLWAGAQYVPLDPTHPTTRLAMILEDAAPHLLVVDAANEAAFAGIRQLRYERDGRQTDIALPGDTLSPLAPAYTIFTSGSTGRPKGVQVTHGALANILLHFQRSPGLDADDCLLAVTTLSFDIAALELFLPLSCGAEVVIAENTQTAASGRLLAELIARHDISVMQATPASWRMLLAGDWEPPEKFRAWCGGEALPLELARDLLARGVRLWNLYGPTETTIWSAETEISAPLTAEQFVPVGCPIRETTIYVLDVAGQHLPAGANGELAIGGAGLSTGYLRDPNQTAQQFRPDPFSARPGSRLYITGDLARARSDGRIEVLGRLDHQIKLNGFRIELGEVEAALRALPGVKDAAAAAIHKKVLGRQLIGYLVAADDAPEEGVWREALATRLPRYMVPMALLRLLTLPLTPNGKIDRKALESITVSSRNVTTLAPEGAVEIALCGIWQTVFALEQVGVEDDFYALGGHSLMVTQIHTRIVRIFHISPPLSKVFRATTPRQLATVIYAHSDAERANQLAEAYLRLRSMTPEQRQALRNQESLIKATVLNSKIIE